MVGSGSGSGSGSGPGSGSGFGSGPGSGSGSNSGGGGLVEGSMQLQDSVPPGNSKNFWISVQSDSVMRPLWPNT